VSVQAEPFTPVHDGFTQGKRISESPALMQTISADGIAISHPVRGEAVVEALHQSDGRSYAVTEAEIGRAHTRLARRGLYVEPTSASVAAALHHLFEEIDEGDEVVAILTGHGLKHAPRAGHEAAGA
jgi:threonine synthase